MLTHVAGAASCLQCASPTALTPVAEASESQELGRRPPRADMPPTQPQQYPAVSEEGASTPVSADANTNASDVMQGPLPASVEQGVRHAQKKLCISACA